MIFVFYFCLAVGITLLLMDATGQLRFERRTARRLQAIGVIAAAGPGLGPVLALASGQLNAGWPFPLIALAYLGLFLGYAAAVAGWLGTERGGGGLRRTLYAALVFLAALPSMVLLFFTPLVMAAGVALARPIDEASSGSARRDDEAQSDPAQRR